MKRLTIIAVALATGLSVASGIGAQPRTERPVLEGPIEAIDLAHGAITVLGQTIRATASRSTVRGDLLAVFGVVRADGTIGVSRIQDLGEYVPGATQVIVSGLIGAVDPLTGHARIGNLQIDYNSLITSDAAGVFAVGDVVMVSGVQPVSKGVLLAAVSTLIASGGQSGIGGKNGVTGAN